MAERISRIIKTKEVVEERKTRDSEIRAGAKRYIPRDSGVSEDTVTRGSSDVTDVGLGPTIKTGTKEYELGDAGASKDTVTRGSSDVTDVDLDLTTEEDANDPDSITNDTSYVPELRVAEKEDVESGSAQAEGPVKMSGDIQMSADLVRTLRGEYVRDFIRGLRGERSRPNPN